MSFEPEDCVERVLARNDSVVVSIADGGAPTIIQGAGAPPGRRRAAATATASKAAAAKTKAKKVQGVHTLSAPTAARGKRTARGPGVRLGDAADDDDDDGVDDARETAEEPDSQPPRKYRRAQALQLTSKDDVALSLVNAVSGRGTDRAAKFFRAATKSAVEHQYEMALANARLNAALAGRFEIQDAAAVRRAGSSAGEQSAPAEMTVRFKEGVRKWREERVEMLHGAELQAVLKYVLLSGGETGKEMLKPFNMAQCSPRCALVCVAVIRQKERVSVWLVVVAVSACCLTQCCVVWTTTECFGASRGCTVGTWREGSRSWCRKRTGHTWTFARGRSSVLDRPCS